MIKKAAKFFVCIVCATPVHALIRGDLAAQNRTIDVYSDTRASYEQEAEENPVLEVLYAARGLDNTESLRMASGGRSSQSLAQWQRFPVDVTGKIQSALHKGALYIQMREDGNPGVFGSLETIKGEPTDLTTIVWFRDKHGVHARRFEGWNNIVLPQVASWCHQQNKRGGGGYFHHHQFEEQNRGLITFEAKAFSHLTFLAANRIADDAATHYDFKTDTYTDGAGDKAAWYGPDFCYSTGPEMYRLKLTWSPEQKGGATLEQPAFSYFDSVFGVSKTIPAYKARDAQALKKMSYPPMGKDGFSPFWIAIDNGRLMLGTGHVESIDDVEREGVEVLYDQTFADFPPFLRHFALCDGGMLQNSVVYRNVRSRVLDPLRKYCSAPFCQGRFFSWRKHWQSAHADSFSVSFKARGDAPWVALSDTHEGRPTEYKYAVRLGESPLVTRGNRYSVAGAKIYDSGAPADGAYYPYWISYNNGVLTAGSGSVVGSNVLISYEDGKPFTGITCFALSGNLEPVDYIDIAIGDAARTHQSKALEHKEQKQQETTEQKAKSFFDMFFAS